MTTTPTDEQYADFGSAVAGIMDAYLREGMDPELAVGVIQLAASTYGIRLGLPYA